MAATAQRRSPSFLPAVFFAVAFFLWVCTRAIGGVSVSGGYTTVTAEGDSVVVYVASNWPPMRAANQSCDALMLALIIPFTSPVRDDDPTSSMTARQFSVSRCHVRSFGRSGPRHGISIAAIASHRRIHGSRICTSAAWRSTYFWRRSFMGQPPSSL